MEPEPAVVPLGFASEEWSALPALSPETETESGSGFGFMERCVGRAMHAEDWQWLSKLPSDLALIAEYRTKLSDAEASGEAVPALSQNDPGAERTAEARLTAAAVHASAAARCRALHAVCSARLSQALCRTPAVARS